MRRFWDKRARENPWYFINNELDYHEPDLEWFWASGERDLDAILGDQGVAIQPTDRVVEIGCGAGRMTRAIAARSAQVIAIDVAPTMLEIARGQNESLDNVEWMLGDGESLAGVADASQDGCISFVVLHHIPDPQITLGYIREMGRVLKPGGWAVFHVSNQPSFHRKRFHGPRHRLASLRGRLPKGQRDRAWLGSWINVEDLHKTAADASLELERIEGAGSQRCMVLARRLP